MVVVWSSLASTEGATVKELIDAFVLKYGEEALATLLKKLVDASHGIPSGPGTDSMLLANALVNGERQADYGSPEQNYAGIAGVWSGLLTMKLKAPITSQEAALMMVGLKIQRQCMKPKEDNMVDAHGYLLVAAHCGK